MGGEKRRGEGREVDGIKGRGGRGGGGGDKTNINKCMVTIHRALSDLYMCTCLPL